MRKRNSLAAKLSPALLASFVFIVLVACSFAFYKFKMGQWEKDVRSEILAQMTGKKSNLEKALYSRIYYTRGVAGYVALNPGITDAEFSELAKEYIKGDTVIGTMALAKDCIISSIYPLNGHEEAVGLNLLDHPERKKMVEKTIETQLTFIAGPVELVEGGIAFISYTPIFDKTKGLENDFWGLTDIVINQNKLFNEAGLHDESSPYEYALRGYDGSGNNGAAFWGDDEIFDKDPVLVNIDLPIGHWVLAAVPVKGWNAYFNQDKTLLNMLIVSALVISVLMWLFARSVIKLRINELQLKAVFNSLDSIIIEYDSEGNYLDINSTNPDMLVLPENELRGKNVDEIFDKKKARIFKEAIRKCIANRELVVVEYPLVIRNEERWFSARISNKDTNTVIFNSYEITENKKREQRLIKSEAELKNAVEMQNKFLSVLAHDLRGPLGSQNNVLDLLYEQYDEMGEETRKKFLDSLRESSHNLFALLENLLKWSMSKSGKIDVQLVEFDLLEVCNNLSGYYSKQAKTKGVHLLNQLNTTIKVFADVNLFETILRNLISNAIKFTPENGEVVISVESKNVAAEVSYVVKVADNGVGIDEERMANLFGVDKAKSTSGTASETGSGFGLILCQELAQKMGTIIKVDSTKGKGSTFSLSVPGVK